MEYIIQSLRLSICDVIVSQKGSNEDGTLHFFGLDYKKEQSVRDNNYNLSA